MGWQRFGHNFHFHLAILFNLYRNHHVLHSGYTILHLQQCTRTPFLISTYSCQHLLFPFFFFNTSHPDDCEVVSHCNFDLHVSKISNAEHFFMWLLAICVFSLEKYQSFAHFLIRFFRLSFGNSLYILIISPFSDNWFANIFFCSESLLFYFVDNIF